jgi:hypothetical protein
MITGYNTDVRHHDLVFHVQTEDKGVANPFIESLIYVGGQVVASKRVGYAELLVQGKAEKDIVALMEHQHRVLITAIRGGKFDERVASLAGAPAPPQKDTSPLSETRATRDSDPERTLDQVILDYLTSEAEQEQLHLVLEEATDLALGNHADIQVRATSSRSGQGVPGAQVTVRMISTVAEPRTLAAGLTDEQGGLALKVLIPPLERGAAALIISASSAIGSAELKQLL